MASSNRHWPSMFKSKPCTNQQWPPHHDISGHPPSLLSNSCSRSSSGCEERSPEPKPRWNPKPEQIRILEAIFNSGMVNPPRDEIRRIRAQLQEYGQVGDANVFYWFQNRKSRSKHKQRSLQAAAAAKTATINHHHGGSPVAATSSSSSTSSDKASPKNMTNSANTTNSTGSNNNNNNNNNSNSSNNNNVVVDQFGMNNSPTSVNQGSYFHQLVGPSPSHVAEFGGPQSMYFPLPQRSPYISQGLCFGGQDVMTGGGEGVTVAVPDGGFSTLLLGEMISGGGSGEVKRDENVEKFKFQQELGFMVANPPPSSVATCSIPPSSAIPLHTSCAISSGLGQFLGVGDVDGVEGKSTVTVFVDDMAVEVPAGPFNVKEAFGEDAMLVHPTGHPVVTNEWGVTLNPLQHGALYYLVRTTISASPLLDKLDTTPDLLAPEFPYQI